MYRDKIAAMFAASQLQKEDDSARGKLEKRVYYSAPCRTWHITSTTVEEYQERVAQFEEADSGSVESGTTTTGES